MGVLRLFVWDYVNYANMEGFRRDSIIITSYSGRVESGSHLLTHVTHRAIRCDSHMTHLWPSCMLKVLLHENNINSRFTHSWQNAEPVSCTDFLKMKSLDITYLKTAWDIKLVSHQWYFSAFIRPKFYSLTRCQHFFLKNMWYPCHIQIIQFEDETHLIYQKVTQVTLTIVRVIQPTFNPGGNDELMPSPDHSHTPSVASSTHFINTKSV